MLTHALLWLFTHSQSTNAYFRPVQKQLLLLVLNRCFVLPMLQSELLLAPMWAMQMLTGRVDLAGWSLDVVQHVCESQHDSMSKNIIVVLPTRQFIYKHYYGLYGVIFGAQNDI